MNKFILIIIIFFTIITIFKNSDCNAFSDSNKYNLVIQANLVENLNNIFNQQVDISEDDNWLYLSIKEPHYSFYYRNKMKWLLKNYNHAIILNNSNIEIIILKSSMIGNQKINNISDSSPIAKKCNKIDEMEEQELKIETENLPENLKKPSFIGDGLDELPDYP